MDEIDLENASPEEINELESRLYGQIHHEPVVFEDREGTANQPEAGLDVKMLVYDASNPSTFTERVVTQTRIVNNKSAQSLNNGRYWNKAPLAATMVNPLPSTSQSAYQSSSVLSTPKKSNITAVQSKIPLEQIKKSPSQLKSSPAKNSNELQNKGKQQQSQKKQQQKIQQNTVDQKKTQTQIDQKKQQNQNVKQKHQNQVVRKNQQNQVNPNLQQQQKKTQNIANQKPLNPLNVQKKARQQQQKTHAQNQQAATKGPFEKQTQKLEKLKRIEKKKEKSKQARLNRIERLNKQQPTEIIILSTSNDEEDDDDDDVMIVPLPPPAIIDVDDSNSNSEKDKCELASVESKIENSTTPYIEENAIDASDVQLEKATMRKPLEVVITAPSKQMSVCNSPSSSVLSTDDFIGQTDRRRLKEDFENVRADDEDLLLLTSDLGTFLKPAAVETQAQADTNDVSENENVPVEKHTEDEQHGSQPEFVPPTNLEAIKEKYRVEPCQFRALDVYESESDFTESGVYSKAIKTNPMATVIRPIGDSSSDEDLNDVEVVEPSGTQKTKRLRKRRASSTNKDGDSVGHSSAIGEVINDDETDTDDSIANGDGIQSSCVSFISRGDAVEHCKVPVHKLKSTSSRSSRLSDETDVAMSDNRFIQSLKILAKGSQADQSDSEDEMTQKQVPSARDIAERVLKKQARNEVKTVARNASGRIVKVELEDSNDEAENDSELVNIQESNNEALPIIACEGLSDVFKQIDSTVKTTRAIENSSCVIDEDSVSYDIPNEAIESLENITSKDLRIMNDEMTYFYDKSWGGESLSMAQCLRRMDKRRQLWRIQPEDRFPRTTPRSNMKCLNCCEFGHVRAKCKQPKKPVVCHTCGCVGHQETRCPKSMCLGCGNRTQLFVRSCNNCSFQRRLICPLCKVRGHSVNTCPDKWRRYHSTTQMNVPLEQSVSYKRKKYCSICGAEGHLSETCRSAPRFMDYPIIVSAIKSHEKVYEDQTISIANPKEPLYVPFHFNWSPALAKNGYYNRFLKAVGLSKLYKRKLQAKKREQDLQSKRTRMLEESFVKNPYAEYSIQKDNNAVSTQPNQVQEVSESGNLDEMISTQSLKDNNSEAADIDNVSFNAEEYQVIDETGEDTESDATSEKEEQPEQFSGNVGFKEPLEVQDNVRQHSSASQPNASIMVSNIDSDSNYSFSDHFELPTSTTSTLDEVSTKKSPGPKNNRKSGPMDNLPEIIPLSSSGNNSSKLLPAPKTVRKSRPMEDLPEVIPLSSGNDDRWETNDDEAPLCTGISMCFAGEEPLSYEDVDNVPSEAKIYMQRSDTEYLFSPEGRQFLNDISKECNVDVQMKHLSCGYVLVIYGLPRNQTKLHSAILNRCKEVRNKSIDVHSQKPPKRVDVLIKYLRDGICQLQGNLGNVDDLYNSMKYQENQNTKNGNKVADKKRRLLNMMLIGQAGLLNGNMHLDQLLHMLRKLIYDHQPDDVASAEMRLEVEKHWRVIFTPYIHTDYQQLLKFYHQLQIKNRIHSLNLEPQLLGQKTLNTSLSEEQKSHLNGTPTKFNTSANNNTPLTQRRATMQNNFHSDVNILQPPSYQKPAIRNGSANRVTPLKPSTTATSTNFTTPRKGNMAAVAASVNYPPSPFLTPRGIVNRQRNPPTNSRRQCQQTNVPPPFANPQQRSAVSLQLHAILPTNVNSNGGEALLNALNNSCPSNASNRAQQASMFWSREALKYVDECLKLTDHSLTLTRLYRVQVKCRSGNLSHNDYLAVIKLYNILSGYEF